MSYISEIYTIYRYWQAITTQHPINTALIYYYNVVVFSKFLTMMTNSSRYIDIEKFLTKRLLLP
jgi:hypothetical protein